MGFGGLLGNTVIRPKEARLMEQLRAGSRTQSGGTREEFPFEVRGYTSARPCERFSRAHECP